MRAQVRRPVAERAAVRRILRRLLERYHDGIAELPEGAFPRWKRLMAGGVAALLLVMFGLVQAGKTLYATGGLAWETAFLQGLSNGPLSFSSAVWWQTFGTDITLLLLVTLTTGIAVWARRPIAAWSIALAWIVIDPVVRIGWLLWDRTRPDVLYQGIARPGFHSFPSGHTAKTLAVYGVLTLIWVRASSSALEKLAAVLILLSIAMVVPLGRLTMGVHWPSDIIGGWAVGLAWLVVLGLGLRLERPRRL
jgi:membrane-associated phospholipid phosphatase